MCSHGSRTGGRVLRRSWSSARQVRSPSEKVFEEITVWNNDTSGRRPATRSRSADRLARTMTSRRSSDRVPAALSVEELAAATEDEPERVETASGSSSPLADTARGGSGPLQRVASGYAFRGAQAAACARLGERPARRPLPGRPRCSRLSRPAGLPSRDRPIAGRPAPTPQWAGAPLQRGFIAESGAREEERPSATRWPALLFERVWGHGPLPRTPPAARRHRRVGRRLPRAFGRSRRPPRRLQAWTIASRSRPGERPESLRAHVSVPGELEDDAVLVSSFGASKISTTS